jgi:hypothetical protein
MELVDTFKIRCSAYDEQGNQCTSVGEFPEYRDASGAIVKPDAIDRANACGWWIVRSSRMGHCPDHQDNASDALSMHIDQDRE